MRLSLPPFYFPLRVPLSFLSLFLSYTLYLLFAAVLLFPINSILFFDPSLYLFSLSLHLSFVFISFSPLFFLFLNFSFPFPSFFPHLSFSYRFPFNFLLFSSSSLHSYSFFSSFTFSLVPSVSFPSPSSPYLSFTSPLQVHLFTFPSLPLPSPFPSFSGDLNFLSRAALLNNHISFILLLFYLFFTHSFSSHLYLVIPILLFFHSHL